MATHADIIAALRDTLRYLCVRTDELIGSGARLRSKLKVKEETITDVNHLDLALRHERYVMTRAFNRHEEGRDTGADWLWIIGRPGCWLPLLVQAKLVDIHDGKCRGFRQPTPKRTLQIELLKRYAADNKLFPLYCVYSWVNNPVLRSMHLKCEEGQEDPRRMGCTLLTVEQVEAFNDRWRHATQAEILQQGHSLASLLRPREHEGPVDLAQSVAAALESYLEAVPAELETWSDEDIVIGSARLVDQDDSPSGLIRPDFPPLVRELLSDPAQEMDGPLRHVTILSDRALPPVEALLNGADRG